MRSHPIKLKTLLLASVFASSLAGFAIAQAQEAASTEAAPTPLTAEQRIERLEQELETLKRQRDLDQELDAAAADRNPTVVVDKKGLKVTSVDKKYEFSLTGAYQFDHRQYLDDDLKRGQDGFISRRLRPTFQLKAGNASFRLTPDFGGSTVRLFDAYAEYKVSDALNVRIGKQKTPVGFERNQSAVDLVFVERGHATNLAPTRDYGVQAYGTLLPNILEYNLGIYNGNPDLGNTDGDNDEVKDYFARVFTTPFANSEIVPLQGLGFGVAASNGKRKGTTAASALPAYTTPGQLSFFTYGTGVFAYGKTSRLNPQVYYYYGPFGVLAEHITSTQTVRLGANSAELKHKALTVSASFVLTGEDVGFKGGVKPTHDLDLAAGNWGALELTGRYGFTDVDDKTFGTYASLTTSASKATSWGVGLSWYTSENLKLLLNYDKTEFVRGAAITVANPSGNRQDETFVSTRVQVRY